VHPKWLRVNKKDREDETKIELLMDIIGYNFHFKGEIKMSKWTNQEIAEKAKIEGLEYLIKHYLSYKSIEDEQLAFKWKKCQELLDEIEEYLSPYFSDEYYS